MPNEKLLSQVLDRYIMRQKVMLSLTIHKNFAVEFEKKTVLSSAAVGLYKSEWPADSGPIEEPEIEEVEEEESDEDEPAYEEAKKVNDQLYEDFSQESLTELL